MTAATVMDHITPIRVDASRQHDPSNWQSLCDDCHKAKTADDQRKYPQHYGGT